MNLQGPLGLILFDCDGVLIDSEGISAEVLLSALARLGREVSFDYFCQNFVGRSFPTVARDIRENWGLKLPDSFEADYRRDLAAEFSHRLQATAGVVDLLEGLTVPYCVATSSSPQRADNALRIAGLDRFVSDRIFTASEVAHGKPAPDLFLHAAARMGVSPDRCLVIEDSLPGIAAADAAKMQVLRYTGGAHLKGRVLKHDADVQTFDNWDNFSVRLSKHLAIQAMQYNDRPISGRQRETG